MLRSDGAGRDGGIGARAYIDGCERVGSGGSSEEESAGHSGG